MHIINRLRNNQELNRNYHSNMIKHKNLTIKSSPCQITKLDGYVRDIMTVCKLSEDMYANILISLTEAVNNAIIHGNKQDTKKKVCIHCEHSSNALVLKIEDQGKGFNPLKVKDPLSPERINLDGGRGVLIMNELCDRVHYHNNGSTVEIHFKIA